MTNMAIIKAWPNRILAQKQEKSRMTRDNLKRSIAAALVAAGVLFAARSAQATIVDLINGDSGIINGAQFDWTPEQPTGTGNIQPFLRVQADGVEQGYNTSGAPVPFDDKVGAWTHDMTFTDLRSTTVMVGNTSFFKVLLDINQTYNSPLLSL